MIVTTNPFLRASALALIALAACTSGETESREGAGGTFQLENLLQSSGASSAGTAASGSNTGRGDAGR